MQATLPHQEAEFAGSGQVFRVATSPREAMDLAYTLEQHLPLPARAFVNFDLGSRFSASPPLVVVAEKVLRVRDHNRPPHCRIDFFCYMPTGEVVRYHPGRSPQGDMQPHTMLPGCNLFDAALARSVGVGAALHQRPPRLVASSGAAQPGELLCTRQDMDAFCPYDINEVNWRQVRDRLAELGDHDQEVDWSDGQHFPWWLWLANTGKIRDVANDGISSVRLSVNNGMKCVGVVSARGTYYLSGTGKMIVTPTPRLHT